LEAIENPTNWVNYTLDWSYSDSGADVPDPNQYTVQEASNPAFTDPVVHTVPGSQTSLAINDEQHEKRGGTYYYRVRGTNAYGPGEWSNIETTVLRVLPHAPSLKPVDNADRDDAYRVSWSYDHTYPPVSSYVLQEAKDANFTVDKQEYPIEGGTAKDFTGKSDGTYYYRVRGKNAYGFGTWSSRSELVRVESFSYFDDFSDPGSGWPSLVDDERWAFYEVDPNPPDPDDGSPYPENGNGYFIARRSGGEPLAVFGPGVAVPSEDYEIEVDTRWWDARWYATYQILFGANESFSNYYAVRVMIDDIKQRCKFSLVKHTSFGTEVLNDGWEDVHEIYCGERRDSPDTPWNHWRIRREDNWIKVHVNDTFLGEWKDTSFGANRYFGVRATLYEGFTPSKPEFDNFSVELLD
jgi:hypothetical protein